MFFEGSLKVLGYTFHLKQTGWKNIENSRNGAPLTFGTFGKRATFSARVLFKWIFLWKGIRKGSLMAPWEPLEYTFHL